MRDNLAVHYGEVVENVSPCAPTYCYANDSSISTEKRPSQ